MSGNGDVPYPRSGDPLVVAREAFRLAWRADEHGIELHASVVRHLSATDGKVDELAKEVRDALRELERVRDRTPSVHDLEEAAKRGAGDALEEAKKELSSPGIPRPPTDSERIRQTIALDEHARWTKRKEAVVAAVLGGGVLTGIVELVRWLASLPHH